MMVKPSSKSSSDHLHSGCCGDKQQDNLEKAVESTKKLDEDVEEIEIVLEIEEMSLALMAVYDYTIPEERLRSLLLIQEEVLSSSVRNPIASAPGGENKLPTSQCPAPPPPPPRILGAGN
ncbi:hypothetical protein Bca101_079657 [Brassica carinata]